MVAIKLPDGSVMNFDGAVSGKEVAEKISAGLAKNALAVKVNDKLQDLAATITTDATVTVITAKDKEGLAILRHSCSHVMAEAVKGVVARRSGHDRTGDRKRFLLRLCPQGTVYDRRLCQD